MKRALLCTTLLSATVKGDESETNFLRRNRSQEQPKYETIKRVATRPKPKPQKLKDVWEHAVATANFEVERERELFSSRDLQMSIPPTPPPTPRPTQNQTQRPTPNPTPNPTPSPTPAPTQPTSCPPGTTRQQYLLDVLKEVTADTLLLDDSTSQGKAFLYMASQDPGLVGLCSTDTLPPPDSPAIRLQQRYGLITTYYALEGSNWVNNIGWLGESQECNWFGVECDTNSVDVRFLQLSTSREMILISRYNNRNTHLSFS